MTNFDLNPTENDKLKVWNALYTNSEVVPYFVGDSDKKHFNCIIPYIVQGMKIIDFYVDDYYDEQMQIKQMVELLLERDGKYYLAMIDGRMADFQINEVFGFKEESD